MPSFIGSPLQLVVAGSEPDFEPRFAVGSPAMLRLAFPSVSVGPGAPIFSDPVTAPRLDRLQRIIRYIEPDGTATPKLVLDWQNTMKAIEAAFAALTGDVSNLEVLVAQIKAAQDLAQAANDTAQQNLAQTNITNSYTDPTSVLTADSAGSITIAAHNRVYGDGRSVAVNAGSLSGFAPGNYVSVYYDDAARAGGAVNYQGTTNAIAQAGERHSVGQITIPAAGSPPATGGGVSAPGYNPADDKRNRYEDAPA